MKLAVALDVLGDTEPLWNAWLDDVARRTRVELAPEDDLDAKLGDWRPLLVRFAEDHAPVYLRPDSTVATSLRALQAQGARMGVYTGRPLELAEIALAHLGAARRVEAVGTLDEVRARLGEDARVIATRDELVALAP